jgi:hypothetical protein
MRCLLFFLFLLPALTPVAAQKVLQIERAGSARTTKLLIGTPITYKVKGDDIWRRGVIVDLLIDRNTIALEDRYVRLDQIEAFRYDRGWARAASVSLYTFGPAWSGFALVGTLTDGDPDTHYRASDAVVTAASLGLGFVVQRLFRHKTVRFGERKRLRLLDLSAG